MEYALSTKFHCDDFPSFAALARRRRGQGAKFCRRRHDLTREGKSSFRFGSGRVGASRDLVPFRRRRPVPIIRRSRSADTGLSVETGPARRLFAEFQTVRARIRRVLRFGYYPRTLVGVARRRAVPLTTGTPLPTSRATRELGNRICMERVGMPSRNLYFPPFLPVPYDYL